MEDKNLDAVNRASCCKQQVVKIPRVVGLALAKKSAAQRCALSPAWELRAAPLSMGFTKATTPSARLGDARPLGAAASRFWTAAGVSYGLAGGVKAARAKSKLGKIEADTVPFMAREYRKRYYILLGLCE